MSLSSSTFGDYVDHISLIEKKDTTNTSRSAYTLTHLLKMGNAGRLRTKRYLKWVDVNVLIVIFPFICSIIPEAHAYCLYISQFIRYSRACGCYHDFR
jgi:hypothetical protein